MLINTYLIIKIIIIIIVVTISHFHRYAGYLQLHT